jgi:glycosyltransferase involved in cell wall biosynthesis
MRNDLKAVEKAVLVDCREWTAGGMTGIGRVAEGLLAALSGYRPAVSIQIAVFSRRFVPSKIRRCRNIHPVLLPASYALSEAKLSALTAANNIVLYISPYPKLPLFGVYCCAINMVHDVLDLTFPDYRRRSKAHLDRWRLKNGVRRACLTWCVSKYTLKATRALVGDAMINAKVRYPALDENFRLDSVQNPQAILSKYGLTAGYILVIGNGKPHKNAKVILEVSRDIGREIVFVGMGAEMERFWRLRFPHAKARWIRNVADPDLPGLLKGAFCLVQPSLIEGFGYPPLEAMACGVPVVVSDIPVLQETTGGNALVADPRSPEQWCHSIKMLEIEALRKRQIARGLRWVEPMRGRLGWNRYVEDVLDLLDRRT